MLKNNTQTKKFKIIYPIKIPAKHVLCAHETDRILVKNLL